MQRFDYATITYRRSRRRSRRVIKGSLTFVGILLIVLGMSINPDTSNVTILHWVVELVLMVGVGAGVIWLAEQL